MGADRINPPRGTNRPTALAGTVRAAIGTGGLTCRAKRIDADNVTGVSLDSATLRGLFSLRKANSDVQTSLERLSTGKRINRASDDPAGLIAGENLGNQIKAIQTKIDAITQQDGYIGAREGAYSVVSDGLTQLSGLIVQAANRDGLSADEKQALQEEATGILKGIDFLGHSTTFKGQAILSEVSTALLGRTSDGVGGTYALANLGQGGKLNLVDGDLEAAQKVVDAAVSGVSTTRATFGNQMKANDAEVANLQEQLTNLSGAQSQIVDTNYAEETAKLSRAQVQQQVSIFALEVTAEQRKGLLELLKPIKLN